MSSSTKQQQLADVARDLVADGICSELAASATQLVPGEGSPDAEVMFIGEAPGAQEDAQGRPFVGASGKLLGAMLESISLSREQVYITNIVKYRPPSNRDPKPVEIAAMMPYLQRQIDIIQPKLIVFLGRHAMNVFLPELKIGQAHGLVVRQDGNVYLPLYHPAAALYNPGQRQTLFDDFAGIPAALQQIKSQS